MIPVKTQQNLLAFLLSASLLSTSLLLAVVAVFAGCEPASMMKTATAPQSLSPQSKSTQQSDKPPASKPDNRRLGLGVTEGAVGYEAAFGVAKSVGIRFIELPQQWDDVAQANGKFKSPFLEMANQVYPTFKTSVVLSLNPIDTSSLRVPKHLANRRMDDPKVIESFKKFVDFTLNGLDKTEITAISIGNEVDAYLGYDENRWKQYKNFFVAIRRHIQSQPRTKDVPVGVKITWSALVQTHIDLARVVNQYADAVMTTYYPLNSQFIARPPHTISSDLKQLIDLAEPKKVFLLETGYPSGKANGSSQTQQALFVDEMFKAWDRYQESIPLVNFIWLYDMSDDEVKQLVDYYAVKTPSFQSFLATLGLHNHEGTAKAAFRTLQKNVKQRGWVKK